MREHSFYIKSLSLAHCEFVGGECCRFFETLERTTLRKLIFDGNLIGDSDPTFFANAVDHMWSVRTLSMNSCRIGCKGASAIAHTLMVKPQLSVLFLQDNRIKASLAYV